MKCDCDRRDCKSNDAGFCKVDDVDCEDRISSCSSPSACSAINIIFDGPPGPEAGRFVEVETDDGKSIYRQYAVMLAHARALEIELREAQNASLEPLARKDGK